LSHWPNRPDQPRTESGHARYPFAKMIAQPAKRHRSTPTFLPLGDCPRQKAKDRNNKDQNNKDPNNRVPASILLQVNHDRRRAEMLCRIAHNPPEISEGIAKLGGPKLARLDGSEQFRPAIIWGLRDHGGRDEHFFSLFQVL
jgi:hypothetical protein